LKQNLEIQADERVVIKGKGEKESHLLMSNNEKCVLACKLKWCIEKEKKESHLLMSNDEKYVLAYKLKWCFGLYDRPGIEPLVPS